MYITQNYRRCGPGREFVDAPETYCCAICGNYIDWPAEKIEWNKSDEPRHEECLEERNDGD